jgi:hypothetical protein
VLIGLTHEDYPEYHDYLSIIVSKVKQKPRVVEEYESMSGIMSAVEAGAGVAIGADVFGYSFGNRVKPLRLVPEPEPISVGIAGAKGRLSLSLHGGTHRASQGGRESKRLPYPRWAELVRSKLASNVSAGSGAASVYAPAAKVSSARSNPRRPRRCRYRGMNGIKRWVGWAVFSNNLWILIMALQR